jgi:hypothetical protein
MSHTKDTSRTDTVWKNRDIQPGPDRGAGDERLSKLCHRPPECLSGSLCYAGKVSLAQGKRYWLHSRC